MNSVYRIIIGGDILPSKKNIKLFESGEVSSLYVEDIRNLFHSADFSIVNLERPLINANIHIASGFDMTEL
ncbi:MAG: CapA family protein [Bacteroidales bacterium]|nr:CapA family protein [Bacteroidales bacterium]